MNDDYVNFYSDARRYDLVLGAYASGDYLNFYRRQIGRYGEPVLELACGSGRLTIPLAEEGANITGLDLSEEMLDLAKLKASKRGVSIRFIQGDIRSFDLGEKFKFIFIPAQSLSHLHKLEEIEDCFSCVRRHLAREGRFLIELFSSSVKLLARESGRRFTVGEYEDPKEGPRVFVTEELRYDAASQVNHIRWFFRDEGSQEETVLSFEMRQFFPQEIDALLRYNGFLIEHKYGTYDEGEFSSDVSKQLIVCRTK
jgi:SAM-dependent methyltransferase